MAQRVEISALATQNMRALMAGARLAKRDGEVEAMRSCVRAARRYMRFVRQRPYAEQMLAALSPETRKRVLADLAATEQRAASLASEGR